MCLFILKAACKEVVHFTLSSHWDSSDCDWNNAHLDGRNNLRCAPCCEAVERTLLEGEHCCNLPECQNLLIKVWLPNTLMVYQQAIAWTSNKAAPNAFQPEFIHFEPQNCFSKIWAQLLGLSQAAWLKLARLNLSPSWKRRTSGVNSANTLLTGTRRSQPFNRSLWKRIGKSVSEDRWALSFKLWKVHLEGRESCAANTRWWHKSSQLVASSQPCEVEKIKRSDGGLWQEANLRVFIERALNESMLLPSWGKWVWPELYSTDVVTRPTGTSTLPAYLKLVSMNFWNGKLLNSYCKSLTKL